MPIPMVFFSWRLLVRMNNHLSIFFSRVGTIAQGPPPPVTLFQIATIQLGRIFCRVLLEKG